ncbi:MAG: hypothetical protein QOI25_3911 [Mycobacterium sp.]|nr:hypothetical protein [Mycobacterium sp.]
MVDQELARAIAMATGESAIPHGPHDNRPEIQDALSKPLPEDPQQFHDPGMRVGGITPVGLPAPDAENVAPAWAKATAVARPIPDPAPVSRGDTRARFAVSRHVAEPRFDCTQGRAFHDPECNFLHSTTLANSASRSSLDSSRALTS